ncbi:MAG: hypothetical protein ACRD5L_15295, partial [Bryobacteraceae bacterium]
VEQQAQIGGSLMTLSGDTTVDGSVKGDILAYSRTMYVGNVVGGNSLIKSDKLRIGSEAQISGTIEYTGTQEAEVAAGAKLGHAIAFTKKTSRPDYASGISYWHAALRWGASFVFGLLLLLVMPQFFGRAVRNANRYGPALGFGLLLLISVPVIAFIACITVVGLGVGISTILLYLISLYGVRIFVAAWIGEKLMGETASTGALVGRLALGLLLLRAAEFVPYAGGWVSFAVLVWGLGALALTLYEQMRSGTMMAAPAA